MKQKMIITMIACIGFSYSAIAQKAAIKTNLLYDATTTFNLGVEFSLAPKWTFDLSGNYNPWSFSDNKKWKHWIVQPEARYWFCNKMMGHFLGFHALGGHRFEGWMIGAGIAYGYTWTLSKHWNLEAELGLGYVFSKYDQYECEKCGEKVESDKSHHYVGPTKAAINLVYVF